MNKFFQTLLFFSVVRLLECNAARANGPPESQPTLKEQLERIGKLSKSQHSSGPVLDLNALVMGSLDSRYKLGDYLDKAVKDSKKLRKLLVKNDNGDSVKVTDISKIPPGDVITLLQTLIAMYNTIIELQNCAEKAEDMKTIDDKTKHYVKLAEVESVVAWLTKNGFLKDDLNVTTTLNKVKELLQEMLKGGNETQMVLYLYAFYCLLLRPKTVSDMLAWLVCFSSSLCDDGISKTLEDAVDYKLPNKGKELVSEFYKLEEQKDAIIDIINLVDDSDVYPIYQDQLKSVDLGNAALPIYWEILSGVCKDLGGMLKGAAGTLEGKSNAAGGEEAKADRNKNIDNAKTLMNEGKPLNKVCQIIKAYGGTFKRKPSGSSGGEGSHKQSEGGSSRKQSPISTIIFSILAGSFLFLA